MKSSALYSKIHTFIQERNLIPPGSKVIVGLSGGPDSVFLTHFLANMHRQGSITLIAAHLNHEWRPEADQEQEFCRRVSADLGIEYQSAKLSDFAGLFKFNGSKEEYARRARRFFFEQIQKRCNADRIALAHHADDQQETFFIRLVRGASLTGLTAIKPVQGLYIRPLLHSTKKEILAYLEKNQITYCTDITNTDIVYLRNALRSRVLPALKACDARFDANFARTLSQLQETATFLDKLTQQAYTLITCVDPCYGSGIVIEKLLQHDPVIRDRLIMHWIHQHGVPYVPQQAFLKEIARFLEHKRGGTHHLHNCWRIIKKQGQAYIQRTT